MSKRQINFTGPSIQELGITVKDINIGNTNLDNTENNNSNSDNAKKGIAKNNNSINNIAKNGNTKKRNTLQFRIIRDYLNSALGDSEKIEVKLSEICEELGINLKTFYKHLKYLRETEFILTKLQYGTEIRRRS